MADNDKLIDDIVSMLDGSVKKGDGHINVKVDSNQSDEKQSVRGCAECSMHPTACSVPTMELPDDDEFQK